jgi:hypothetical protein
VSINDGDGDEGDLEEMSKREGCCCCQGWRDVLRLARVMARGKAVSVLGVNWSVWAYVVAIAREQRNVVRFQGKGPVFCFGPDR